MQGRHILLLSAAAACSLATNAFAQAPSAGTLPFQDGASARSVSPAKTRVYVGLSLGRSRYPCGSTSFSCDSTDNSVRISAGNMPGNFWGVELAYLDMGRIGRSAGTTAQGLSMSLVAKSPVWQSLGAFGKVGASYGRNDLTPALANAVPGGLDRGFGLSLGAGVSYDFTPRLSATLALDSHDFRFAGGGRDPVRSASLGLQYRY